MSSKTTHKRSRARALIAESRATALRQAAERVQVIAASKGKLGDKVENILQIVDDALAIDNGRQAPEQIQAALRVARDFAEAEKGEDEG